MPDEQPSDSTETSSASGDKKARDGNPPMSTLGNLFHRRVPQVLAGYLGVTWTLFELLQWLTDQYLISPYLGRAMLFGLLMLIPSVLLVTYRHGRPGPDPWTATERYSVIGNALGAVLVLVAVYGGVELGSMVKTVRASPEADTSTTVVRQIPKKTFREQVALFYFDQAAGAAVDTASRRMVPTALRVDLRQDDFIGVQFIEDYDRTLRERGYGDGLDVPLGLKREIAQAGDVQYILSGAVGHTGDTFRVTTRLYETKTGEQVAAHTIEGEQLFPLVDQATTHLKEDLQLPEAHREKTADLPVTQVFTSSRAAAKHYAQGVYYQDGREAEDQTALARYRRAAKADSTFALAHVAEAGHHWRFGRRAEARAAYQQAQRHDYRLSRLEQYQLDAQVLLWVEQNPKAALQVCERWTTLHPYTLEGWTQKARIHETMLQYGASLESYQQALALSPENKALQFQVGEMLLRVGSPERAAQRFSTLTETYPEEEGGYARLGHAHWMWGRHDAAEEAFRTIQRIDPDAHPTSIGRLYQATGQFEEALRALREAARRGDADRNDGYQLWHHHWLQGRIENSKAVLDSLQTAEVQYPSFHQVYLAWRTCHYYTQSSDPALIRDARSKMQDLAAKYEGTVPSYEVMSHVGLTSCNVAAGNLEAAQRHIAAADSIVQATGRQSMRLRYQTDYYRGRLHAAKGDYDRAAQSYEQFLDILGIRQFFWTERRPRVQLALAYQRTGAPETARTMYQQALDRFPAHPHLNYHYARFLVDQEEPAEARSHLRRALEGWAPADSTFSPKQRAQALVDSLGGAV